jgi:hypothetical protein
MCQLEDDDDDAGAKNKHGYRGVSELDSTLCLSLQQHAPFCLDCEHRDPESLAQR